MGEFGTRFFRDIVLLSLLTACYFIYVGYLVFGDPDPSDNNSFNKEISLFPNGILYVYVYYLLYLLYYIVWTRNLGMNFLKNLLLFGALCVILIGILVFLDSHSWIPGTTLLISVMYLFYTKVPIEEFKNSSNIERIVHGVVLFITILMIYLYSNYPQPKMKGFVLIVLVLFLNTIAILYGSRNTGIAPGQKLARVFKWFIYISIISTIIWYNTYGTVKGETVDDLPLYGWFNIRDSIRKAGPLTYPLKSIESWLTGKTETERTQEVEDRGKESLKEERREISEDYYD